MDNFANDTDDLVDDTDNFADSNDDLVNDTDNLVDGTDKICLVAQVSCGFF